MKDNCWNNSYNKASSYNDGSLCNNNINNDDVITYDKKK